MLSALNEPALVMRSESTIAGDPMLADLVEPLTRYLGAHEVLVAARVILVDGLSSDQIADMSSELNARVCVPVTPKLPRYLSTPPHQRAPAEVPSRNGSFPVESSQS
jgi:hypothetical protein